MRREELESKTKQELLELARRLGVPGRTLLSKDGLVRALVRHSVRNRAPAFVPREKPAHRAAPIESRSRKSRPAPKPAVPKRAPSPSARKVTKAVGAPTRKGATRPAPKSTAPTSSRPTRTRAGRTARDAPDERAARGGPFGPESEKLHGAAVTPPLAAVPGNGRPGPRAALGAPLSMPERYGRDYAALMVRDPYWLHAYWEVTAESVEALRRKLGREWDDHRWVMRVMTFPPGVEPGGAEEESGEDRSDLDLPYGAQSWYLNVGRPDHTYRIAIGVLTRSGAFHALARSNVVRTPRDSYSPVTDEEWTTLPEAFRRLYESSRELGVHGRSSAELGLLLRERLRSDWSSGMLGSMASGVPLRGAAERAGFWFILDAELIVYGATEPNAKVTVQGRPVGLRPDGTFTLRFQLPDGTQVIDATAISADSVFRKTITPTVRRETHATEMIETRAES
jgi:hypothetical protein